MPIPPPRTSLQNAQKQERENARRYGGRVTVGSGNRVEKGDVRVKGKLRMECKSTKHASFSVTRDMLEKIEREAGMAGEIPALVVRFLEGGHTSDELAVVPMWVLDRICTRENS